MGLLRRKVGSDRYRNTHTVLDHGTKVLIENVIAVLIPISHDAGVSRVLLCSEFEVLLAGLRKMGFDGATGTNGEN